MALLAQEIYVTLKDPMWLTVLQLEPLVNARRIDKGYQIT
jgi:hypothetical protein